MEDLWRRGEAVNGPVGASKASDAECHRQQFLTTPKKSFPEADFGQWNMWGDEKSRSNPASLLAPCTPEIIARVQSVLASPNSEDEWTKAGYPIQQLLSYVMENDDSPNSSTSSSIFYSSDEEVSMMDSPRKFPIHASFARNQNPPRPSFGLEPQEPAALPPQLAYGMDKRVALAVASSELAEQTRIRQHGRQYSDSSISDETTGYLSSSPSSCSSSSSSYVSSGSAQSHYYGSLVSSSFESAGSTFPTGLYPGHGVSSMAQPFAPLGYVQTVPGVYPPGNSMGPSNPANFPYFGHGQLGPHQSHNGPFLPPSYGQHHMGLFHYPGSAYHHPSAAPMHFPHPEPSPAPMQAPMHAPTSNHSRIKSLDAIPTYIPSNVTYRAESTPPTIEPLEQRSVSDSAGPVPAKSWDQLKTAKAYIPSIKMAQANVEEGRQVPLGSQSARSIQSLDSTPQLSPLSAASALSEAPVSAKSESATTGATSMRGAGGKSRHHEKRISSASSDGGSDTPRSNTSSRTASTATTSSSSCCSSSTTSSSSYSSSTSSPSASSSAVASPRSKENCEKVIAKLKEIGEEKGFEEAQAWALTQIPNLSRSAHAKLSLEMADLAKRDNCQRQARLYYQIATSLNPGDSKCWLEWAKMEEESGQLDFCEEILAEGLRHCGANSESLVLRSVRILKARDKIHEARALIGRMLAASENFAATTASASRNQQSQQETTGLSKTAEIPRNGSNPTTPAGSRSGSFNSLTSSQDSTVSEPSSSSTSTNTGTATTTIGDVREWRIVLEGAMLEWRAGRPQLAHSILKFLQTAMPNRTQPYMSRADLYKKEGLFAEAYECILTGLQWLPNAGMLWFEAIQLQQQLVSRLPNTPQPNETSVAENTINTSKVQAAGKIQVDGAYKPKSDKLTSSADSILALGDLPSTAQEYFKIYLPKFVDRALANLSPELIWKFHLELSSIHESHGDLASARRSLGASVHACPSNLLWRVWLAGVRLELFGGEEKAARRLLIKAAKSVPKKMSSTVLLECARTEEYLGNVEQARYILTKAKRDTKFEWKVFLENILLEMRCGAFEAAIKETRAALEIHPSAGRLWAILIQAHHFCHYDKFDVSQMGTEASRGFEITKTVFHEALKEVPKSGEVWCEGARIAMHAGRFEEARRYLSFAVELTSQYGDTTIEWIRLKLLEDRAKGIPLQSHASTDVSTLVTSDRLAQLCAYADPNYGPVWTFCKQFPHDPCISTMQAAKSLLIKLESTDPTMDIAHHLLGLVKTDEESRKRLIFF